MKFNYVPLSFYFKSYLNFISLIYCVLNDWSWNFLPKNGKLTFSLFPFSWLQRVQPFDKRYQYLLFAAEPYEIIGFKVNLLVLIFICEINCFPFWNTFSEFVFPFQVPSTEIDKSTPKFFSHWEPDSKMFTVSLLSTLSTTSFPHNHEEQGQGPWSDHLPFPSVWSIDVWLF